MYGNSFGKASKANVLERVNSRRPGQTFSESIIKCKCHAKILVIPDLKAMSKALNTHMTRHRKMEKDNSKTNSKVTKLVEDNLIAEVFKKATGLKI
jgi:hypothetical protein